MSLKDIQNKQRVLTQPWLKVTKIIWTEGPPPTRASKPIEIREASSFICLAKERERKREKRQKKLCHATNAAAVAGSILKSLTEVWHEDEESGGTAVVCRKRERERETVGSHGMFSTLSRLENKEKSCSFV